MAVTAGMVFTRSRCAQQKSHSEDEWLWVAQVRFTGKQRETPLVLVDDGLLRLLGLLAGAGYHVLRSQRLDTPIIADTAR